jgi:hypothetical protein
MPKNTPSQSAEPPKTIELRVETTGINNRLRQNGFLGLGCIEDAVERLDEVLNRLEEERKAAFEEQ